MDAINNENSFYNPMVQELVKALTGQPNCRKRVGSGKSFSLGFGRRVNRLNPKSSEKYYGEWELGTYNCAWRVISNGSIHCGSQDTVDSMKQLDDKVQSIELGRLRNLMPLNIMDIRLEFDGGILIDFLPTTSDEDEVFHIFCPESKYVEFAVGRGWIVGESNKPWVA